MEALNSIIKPFASIFNAIIHPFVILYLNLLMACYLVLNLVHIPYSFGFAIILSTLLIKLVTYPLNSKQMRFAKKVQELSPQISKLKKQFKGDTKGFMEAQKKLYRENEISQAAGCLPVLIQLPIFFGLYQVLTNVVKHNGAEQINYINSMVWGPLKISSEVNLSFFGIPLSQTPSQLIPTLGFAIALIPIITAVATFIQSKMALPTPVKEYKSDSPKEKSEKRENAEMAEVMQKQMVFMMPLFIGILSFTFPIGLSLYWITFTIFGIIQQYKISGWGGMTDIWQKLNFKQKN